MEFTQEEIGTVCVLTPVDPDTKGGWSVTLKALRNRVNVLTERGTRKLIIDMSQVDFLDSTGIGTVVGCLQRMMSVNGLVLFCGFGLRTAETLGVVNLLSVVPIRVERLEALAELEKARPEKDACKRLAAGNPDIQTLRDTWKNRCAEENAETETEASPPSSDTKSDVQPEVLNEEAISTSLPKDLSGDYRLWISALETMMRARKVYTDAGLKFDADISFKEFIGRLAEALIDARGGKS